MNLRTVLCLALFTGLVVGLSADGLVASDDDDKKGKSKGVYHDTMEEIEDLYLEIKNARTEVDKYPQLAEKAHKMQPLFDRVIPMTTKVLTRLGTAKTKADFLEAKSLMVEALANTIGLEAALLKKDPELVKKRLSKLNRLKNTAHREFQP